MKLAVRLLALALVGATPSLLVGAAGAGDKGGETEAQDKARFITIMTEAYGLAEAGKENRSPMMLVTAGGLFRVLKGNEKLLTEAKVNPTVEYEKDAQKGEPAPRENPRIRLDFDKEAEVLFDAARSIGGDLPEVERMIKSVKADKEGKLVWGGDRGNVKGPQAINRILAGGATHVYRFPFAPGVPAAVGFRASAPCQFTIVRADNEHVIAAGVVQVASRQWVPAKAKKPLVFTVRVKNLTRKPVPYLLLTN
jgi:hypothetical protein